MENNKLTWGGAFYKVENTFFHSGKIRGRNTIVFFVV